MKTQVTQVLLEMETPNVARNAAAVRTDLRQLFLDSIQLSLQQTLQKHPEFELRIKITTGAAAVDPLLRKSEVAQYTGMSVRNVERCVKAKKLPEPVRIAAPHCANGAPRWFAEDIRMARHD